MERKNPLGLVRAFQRAFGDEEKAVLFIKVAHSEFDPASFADLQVACQAGNVRLHEEVMPRQAVNALMATADCYVSLHRSEGFGLTMSEAMSLGKPVIATGYSGNMDFMAAESSFLVDYRMVEIEKDYGPYQKGYVWADPDLDHAVKLMRRVYEHRDQAAAVGRRAREDAYRLLHPQVVGKLVKQRLVELQR